MMQLEPGLQAALEEIDHCNKCGFCLPACPTYRLTGNEVDSPRGRIALVEGVLKDEIAVDRGLEDSLTYCLGCRACETACPSGVQYHRILDAGRTLLDKTRPHHRGLTFIPRTLLRLTRQPRQLKRLGSLGRRLSKWPMPRGMKNLVPMLKYRPQTVPSTPGRSEAKKPVTFFQGCVQEALFADANQACQELLGSFGYRVDVPSQQTCCGALAWHAGKTEQARNMARRNIAAFEAAGQAPLVNTAGGCGAMLSEYAEILADDPKWADRAERFSGRVRDWTGLIQQQEVLPRFVGQGDRVVLQNSCHLVNVEGGGDGPADLAKRVEGDTFLELKGQNQCCGSAGIYNIQHPDWSGRLLDKKMEEVSGASPDRIVVVNPGCQLQMTWGVNRANLPTEVEHLARYLYRAFVRGQREIQTLDQFE